MLIVNFDPFPELNTERTFLRRITKRDAEELFVLRTDERVLKYLGRDPATSVKEIHTFIKGVDAEIKLNKGIMWAIIMKDNGAMAGTTGYHNIVTQHYRAEVGYSLLPEYQRKGLMHEVLNKVLEYGFKTMGLHTVEANIDPDNEASMKLLEKNNFVREAHFKENFYYNGKFQDSFIYSLINPFDK